MEPGDVVCDATCGNGHDSVIMAELALADPDRGGKLYCFDIQDVALHNTREMIRAKKPAFMDRVHIENRNHRN